MSDSEEDLMEAMRLQHERTGISTTGSNRTFVSFKQKMPPTMPPLATERFATHGLNQHSLYYRRETSPMSLSNFPDSGIQSYNSYPRGISSARSEYNGRGASTMSVRSMNSNASVTAHDIKWALENTKFTHNEWRLIQNACKKYRIKNRVRKRIDKNRTKLKLYMKGSRRRSCEDSGDQASDSSLSSDDGRSIRTCYRDNRPRSVLTQRTNISQIRASVKDCEMFKDCTYKFKQNSLRNEMYKVTANNSNNNSICKNNDQPEKDNGNLKDRFEKASSSLLPSQRFNKSNLSNSICKNNDQPEKQNCNLTLKDRFEKGSSFLLPSQRFNKSTDQSNISSVNGVTKSMQENLLDNNNTDNEDIFSNVTVKENTSFIPQTKTNIERCKIDALKKQNDLPNNTQTCDFNFIKPKPPTRKSANKKNAVPERVIAMSKHPDSIGDTIEKLPQNSSNLEDTHLKLPVNSTEIDDSNDVSTRPSFMKRKLFTQKLDIAENKNLNSDVDVNSPQVKQYGGRERNKVRKLVSSQSCLSRDIIEDDNVLDLIHKIVPAHEMNTTATKKRVNKSNPENDKWDVTSVISTCNNGDISDTFTDEDIFEAQAKTTKQTETFDNIDKVNNLQSGSGKNKSMNKCTVLVEKLPSKMFTANNNVDKIENNYTNKRNILSCVNAFWNTDSESDMDRSVIKPKNRIQEYHDIEHESGADCSNLNINKKSALKGTILTTINCNTKTTNINIVPQNSKVVKVKPAMNCKEKKQKTTQRTKKVNVEEKINSKSNSEVSKNKKIKSKADESNSLAQNSKVENKLNKSRESLRLKEKMNKKMNDNEERCVRTRQQQSKENNDPTVLKKSLKEKVTSKIKMKNTETNNNISTSFSDSSLNISISSKGRIRRPTRYT